MSIAWSARARWRCAAAIRPARRSRTPITRESADETRLYLDRVVRTRQPVLYRGTYQPLSTRTQREDVLFLPLSKDGETVDMIMILGHIDWMKDETRI